MIPAESMTTEFNTLFETVTSIAEKVDPIKLNRTLTSAAQALSGLSDRFGDSLEHANVILDDLNPRMRDYATTPRALPTSPTSTPGRRPTCSTVSIPWSRRHARSSRRPVKSTRP
jgi:Cholesterol uptake porter CUP1 of Mce4, putative